MPIKQINKALKSNFKELDRAYLNTLESVDARLLAAYKTALDKVGKEILGVYQKFGDKPSITEVRKFNRLVTIEKQMSDKIVELDRTVRNVISSQIKTALVDSYSSTVNGVNQGLGFDFVSSTLNEDGMKRFLADTLWSDSMKNNSADLMSKVKRDFETVLRANSREEILAGVAEGKSYAAIMKDLQARFEISATRAKTIAFTETHKAHSYGRDEGITNAMNAIKEFDIEAYKVWRHNGVGKPRPDHLDADGTFANKAGMFNVGGEELSAPGLGSDPSNNINCHCSAEFEVADNPANIKAVEILESKADIARNIFSESYGKEGVSRGDIISRFMNEAGLTKAGASTYYQNLKKEFELGKLGSKPPVSKTPPVSSKASQTVERLKPSTTSKREFTKKQIAAKDKLERLFNAEMPDNFYTDDFEEGLNVSVLKPSQSGSYYAPGENAVYLDGTRHNTKYLKQLVTAHEGGHARHFTQDIIGYLGGDAKVLDVYADHLNVVNDMIKARQGTAVNMPYSSESRQLMMLKSKLSSTNSMIESKLFGEGFSANEIREMKGSMNDYFAALTHNKVGYGHTKEYFKEKSFRMMEWFAHCSENYYVGNRYFQELFPEIYESTITYMKSIAK